MLAATEEHAQDAAVAIEYAATATKVRQRALELQRAATALMEEIVTIQDSDHPDRDQLIRDHEHVLQRLDIVRDQQYVLVSEALGGKHSPEEVRAWCERAMEMGAVHPAFNAKLLEDLMYLRRVPNAPFRERLAEIKEVESQEHRDGDTYIGEVMDAQIAKAVGWDNRLARRNLGISPRPSGGAGGGKSLTMFIDYDDAVKLASIMGLVAHQAGI